MAKLKQKQNQKQEDQNLKQSDNGKMTEEEMASALANEAEERAVIEGATERLNLLLGFCQRKFGLDDTYTVQAFNDKGKNLSIVLENPDVVLAITLKDSERHGFVVEK